jgi:hypothetical protein
MPTQTRTESRTFVLQSPHMLGDDVKQLQRTLSKRFEEWEIHHRVDDDGDYGALTRTAARQVCKGLGILHETAMADGVTPELRGKLRDPARRTKQELERGDGPKAREFRSKLRKRFKDHGEVVVAPGANLPGKPMKPVTLQYVARMAALLGKPIVITTGTNHDKLTVNGNISDHFSGHAADIGMAANGGTIDGPVGDHIMEMALILAGVPVPTARVQAHGGGLFTFVHDGLRIQCIWKTMEGGNHHDHVHVGVKPA